MNAEQIRARLAEINARIGEINAGDLSAMTDEQVTEVEGMHAEIERLTKALATAAKLEDMQAKTSAPQARKVPASTPGLPSVQVIDNRSKFGGFNSSGDFLKGVRAKALGASVPEFQNVAYEKNGEDGGFLVPEDISDVILKKLQSSESMLEDTRKTTIGGNAMSMPVDESQPWNSGIQAYWVAEGAPIPDSKAKFSTAHLRLHKLGALVKATDELLEDAPALDSYIKNAAPEAIMHKLNNAILTGNGVGKPQGLLTSPFTITIPKEVGQAADTVVAANILKMYSALMPSARAGAKWYVNAGVEAAFAGLTNPQGQYIYLGPGVGLNQQPYGVLLGLPVVPMMSGLPGLGDSGDVLLANLDYYWTIVKSAGIKSAISIHLHFDREITAYRFTFRVDGKVPFQSPVTTEFGNYQMSAFVKLADRA